MPDTQKLQINPTKTGNESIVAGTLSRGVSRKAVRAVHAFRPDVNVLKKIILYVIIVILLMLRGKTNIFVKIYAMHFGKIYITLPEPFHELPVNA